MTPNLIESVMENSAFVLTFGLVFGTIISILVYALSLFNHRSN